MSIVALRALDAQETKGGVDQAYAGLPLTDIVKFLSNEVELKRLYLETGIRVAAQELRIHAPGESARTSTGVGVTLCGYRGVRGPNITCKLCQRRLVKVEAHG